jgi:hypothetical protein
MLVRGELDWIVMSFVRSRHTQPPPWFRRIGRSLQFCLRFGLKGSQLLGVPRREILPAGNPAYRPVSQFDEPRSRRRSGQAILIY